MFPVTLLLGTTTVDPELTDDVSMFTPDPFASIMSITSQTEYVQRDAPAGQTSVNISFAGYSATSYADRLTERTKRKAAAAAAALLPKPSLKFLSAHTATMQSSGSGYTPFNGIDSNVNTLAHSDGPGTNTWWQVDLGAEHVVSQIQLHNRMDHGCGWRILNGDCKMDAESGPGFTLGVSSTPCTGTNLCGGTVCRTITLKSETPGMKVPSVACPANTVGRFVYVQLLGPNRVLNFGEMQVAFAEYFAPMPELPEFEFSW